jgi:hypothetical protein
MCCAMQHMSGVECPGMNTKYSCKPKIGSCRVSQMIYSEYV